MANTTWSTTDKSASVTLSGGNLVATATAGGAWVRAADVNSTGRWYWEVTMSTWTGGTSGPGVANRSSPLNAYNAPNVISDFTNGNVWGNNVLLTTTLGTGTSGTTIAFAWDAGAQLIWLRVLPSGNWNASAAANPATGIGGYSTSGYLGGGFGGAPSVMFSAAGDVASGNFGGSAFTGAVPSGFTSGFTAGAVVPTSAMVTQVTVEQWAATATIAGQALVTQVALEQWVPAAVDLAGNLGAPSHYGKLSYGLKHYSRISAFAPIFTADVTVTPALNLSGGLSPVIVLAADLDVHVNLIDFAGDLAPQIALGGPLTVLSVGLVFDGSLPLTVVFAASSFVSGPLWAAEAPPAPPWSPSEPCPPSLWTPIGPCDPVTWKKTELCHG